MAIIKKCSDCGERADLLENITHKSDCKKLKRQITPPTTRQKRKKLTEADKKKIHIKTPTSLEYRKGYNQALGELRLEIFGR